MVAGVRDTLGSGFYSRLPSTFYFVSNQQLVRRFIAGNNTTWQPLSWLTGSAQLGLDAENSTDEALTPSNIGWMRSSLERTVKISSSLRGVA